MTCLFCCGFVPLTNSRHASCVACGYVFLSVADYGFFNYQALVFTTQACACGTST